MIAGERFLFRGRTVWKLDYGEEYVKKVSSRRNETEKVSVHLHPLSISLFLWTKNNKSSRNRFRSPPLRTIGYILTAVSPLVSVFFGGSAGVNIIPPLICWLVWKDANSLVDKVGKNILNAQISWAIYTVAACLSCLILIGFVLAPVVVIAWIVFSIIAAVKAANGNYDYVAPFTIKFLK